MAAPADTMGYIMQRFMLAWTRLRSALDVSTRVAVHGHVPPVRHVCWRITLVLGSTAEKVDAKCCHRLHHLPRTQVVPTPSLNPALPH
jgi:hypothetical protein